MTAMTMSMTKTTNGKITYSLEELMHKDDKQSQRRERSVNLSSLKSPGTPGRSKKKVQKGSSSRKLHDEGYNSDGILSKKKNEIRSKNKGASISKQAAPPSPPPPPPPETPPPGTPKTPRSRKTPKQIRRGSGGALIGGSKAVVDEGTGYSSDGAMSKRKSEIRLKLQAEKRQGQTPSRTNSGSSEYNNSPGSNAAGRKRAVLRKFSSDDDDSILKSPGGINRNSPRIIAGQKIRRTSTTKSNDEDENFTKSPSGVAGWKAKRPSTLNNTKSSSTDGSELSVKSMPTNVLSGSPQKKKRPSSLFKKIPSNRNMDGDGSEQRLPRLGSQRKGMDSGSDHRSSTPSRSRSRPNLDKVPSNRRMNNTDRSASPNSNTRMKRSGMKRDGKRLGDVKKLSDDTHSIGTISLSTNSMSTADSDEETIPEEEMTAMNTRPKINRAASTPHLNSDIISQEGNYNDAAKINKRMKKLVDDNSSLRRENQKLLEKLEKVEDRLNEERLKSFALKKGGDNYNDNDNDTNEGSNLSDLRKKIEELEEENKQLKSQVAEKGMGDAEVDMMSRPQLIDTLYQTKKLVLERDNKIARQNVELEQLRNTTIQQATKHQEEKQDHSVEREEMESKLKSKDDTIQHLMLELERLKLGGNSVHSQGTPYKRFNFAGRNN